MMKIETLWESLNALATKVMGMFHEIRNFCFFWIVSDSDISQRPSTSVPHPTLSYSMSPQWFSNILKENNNPQQIGQTFPQTSQQNLDVVRALSQKMEKKINNLFCKEPLHHFFNQKMLLSHLHQSQNFCQHNFWHQIMQMQIWEKFD